MVIPDLTIRPMKPGDLAFAANCTAAEGWFSENLSFLEGFHAHDPAGCLLADLTGQSVGICVATSYGESGFIGELIVRPEARGIGIGAALLNKAIQYLQERGAKTIYLDGVVKAVELYERNGFRKICPSLRFSGTLPGKFHPNIRAMQSGDLPVVYHLDQQAFGADRSFFLGRRLELFPELCKVMMQGEQITGFILGKRTADWISTGPWVITENAQNPIQLLESLAVELNNLPINIGVLEINQPVVELLRSHGFIERPAPPWRMALGVSENLGASTLCYAVGSAAKG